MEVEAWVIAVGGGVEIVIVLLMELDALVIVVWDRLMEIDA
jgi:hypothetical protein